MLYDGATEGLMLHRPAPGRKYSANAFSVKCSRADNIPRVSIEVTIFSLNNCLRFLLSPINVTYIGGK